ncbi:MAG: thioredoxin family protein [Elusimicrobiota bacterium]|nr:MAG: thioredoxin family protein [Elusimicrobiota bacterium]
MRHFALAAALALSACGKKEHKGPYDPSRDAGVDIQAAVARAKAENKRVLVEAGGNWCPWCHTMHAFYDANPKLAALRDEKFVTVLVAVEPGKPLPRAISSWPAPAGFPHLYVLDENGSLLQSQDTSALEKGQSYDLEKFEFFLKDFGTKRR